MSIIDCQQLSKHFEQGGETITAIDNVSLQIDSGAFMCLCGPSGSGKTTLLNAIGGLSSVDAGQITVGGERIDQMDSTSLASLRLNKIGFVFQAYNLVPVLSARENVEFVMEVQGIDAASRKEKSQKILSEVGLEGLGDRLPSELSGGQQQRVAVARAVVSEPLLVLADEPTANLDSKSATQLIELFLKLNEQRGVTFVIATHDARVIEFCKRVVRMEDGCIVADQQQNS